MITAKQCLDRYGHPEKENNMTVLQLAWPHSRIAVVPSKIYCNRDMIAPLQAALENIRHRQLVDQLKTWEGCFNIRRKRGNNMTWSLHAWGLAVDVNAAWNRFGQKPTLTPEFVQCWTDAGFDWGGDWKGKSIDGMHFQLREFPK